MLKKRHITIALGVVSFLLGSLFYNNVILAQSGGEYDPWLDYNEDGIIDVNDLQPLGQSYGTSGDPTKNVTIVGHATKLVKAAINVYVNPSTFWLSDFISVDGYSKVSVLVWMSTYSNKYQLRASDYALTFEYLVDEAKNFNNLVAKTYDVINQQIRVAISNNDSVARYIYVEVYLMA